VSVVLTRIQRLIVCHISFFSCLFGLVSDRVPPKQKKNPKSIDDKITPPSIVPHRSEIKSKTTKNKKRWVGLARLTAETAGSGPLADFVEGLGPGQLVGRQVLAAPALGDVQLALCDRKGRLEVEVIRARGLQARTGSKLLPGK
jgi:regulating synaptic membrane exocytosis protein 2